MEFKDYYKILGVEPDTETKDIKAAYRRLARRYHPDLNPGEEAEDKFKEVAEAWEVLGDTERRAEYDELRRYGGRRPQDFEPPPGWQSASGASHHHFSGDFSDFFNSVFGAGFEPGAAPPLRGQDVEIQMPVFLEETLKDSKKPVAYRVPEFAENGMRQVEKSLQVTIPAGVLDGERVRVKGQGAPGRGNGPAGDLFLHIRLVPHPLYDVEGRNLSITVPIAPWEAALGTKVVIPTLDGKINLTVKPGSQSGQRLRVRGKGLVGRSGTGSGDLYAVLKVVMPPTGDKDLQDLWRQLQDKANFDPRAAWGAAK